MKKLYECRIDFLTQKDPPPKITPAHFWKIISTPATWNVLTIFSDVLGYIQSNKLAPAAQPSPTKPPTIQTPAIQAPAVNAAKPKPAVKSTPIPMAAIPSANYRDLDLSSMRKTIAKRLTLSKVSQTSQRYIRLFNLLNWNCLKFSIKLIKRPEFLPAIEIVMARILTRN